MEDLFDRLSAVTGITKYSGSEVITPAWVVSDMVDLLPAEVFAPSSKFLDPAVKSGRFLSEIYRRLMNSKQMAQTFPNEHERERHILDNQLYGFATSAIAATITRKALYNDPTDLGNIRFTGDKVTKELIQGAFGIMKFDVVIGNPPYNNDIYLDFVTLGHNLASKYTCMITPAKWQAKGGDKNEKFRKDIVPYMSKIVFYPVATDIFNIAEVDGVSIAILDKSKHCNKYIENKSTSVGAFNNVCHREIGGKLNNITHNLVEKMKQTANVSPFEFQSSVSHFGFEAGDSLIYTGDIGIVSGGKVVGTCSINDIRKNANDVSKVTVMMNRMAGYCYFYDDCGKTTGINKLYILGNKYVAPFNYSCLCVCDTVEQAKSFVSYMDTKLIRFLCVTSLIGTNLANKEAWRCIFIPNEFDHIFTDQELYQKYGLTPDEIAIIESVIKERK